MTMQVEVQYRPPSSPSLSVSSTSSSESDTRQRSGSWRTSTSDCPTLKQATLLWINRKLHHIWDVDFMLDGTILVIGGQNAKVEGKITTILSKEIYCLNLKGQIIPNPFPYIFRDPGGINVNRSTGAVAVTDKTSDESQGTIIILKDAEGKWNFKSTLTHKPALRVALTDTDKAICAIRWEELVKYTSGKKMWSKSIASSNNLVPYVAKDSTGRIIVSTPVNKRVSVFDAKGQLVTILPNWFVKRPTGVCVDSEDRIFVADRSHDTILQFTGQGQFIQKVVTMKEEPQCICLYEDKYLAVGTNCDGLYLYELEWE